MTRERSAPKWLILGLGNPGEEYEETRHNIGFAVVDTLAHRHHIALTGRLPALLWGRGRLGATEVLLAKPRTYMNLSGLAAVEALKQWSLAPEQLLVILDDVALPLGTVRVRKRGSDGGHKGLRSILTALKTQDVPRVRVGIGQPRRGEIVDFVLSRFTQAEWPVALEGIERAANAVEVIVTEGLEVAMNRFNTRGPS